MRPFVFIVVVCLIRSLLASEAGLQWTITAAARGRVAIAVKNESAERVEARVAGGAVLSGVSDRAEMVALRSAGAALEARGAAEFSIPAAALSSRALNRDQAFTFTGRRIAALEPLIAFLEKHDDVPAVTGQLLVLCFTEDVSLDAWKKFRALQHPPNTPAADLAPEEITAAIDALGVLREVAPQRTFALATDPELKLRALRNPGSRLKAMALYGLGVPGVAPLPPDLGSLLHTKPGDNCPICRQRALMQPREDGF